MTPEDRKLLLSEIINAAQEVKNHVAIGSPGRTSLNRIIRLSKRMYVDAIKLRDNEELAETP